VAFASLNDNSSIWSLPIEPNLGKATGQPKRLIEDAAVGFEPAVSPDGNKMAWVSGRSGSQEIWIRDLRTNEDFALTASRMDKSLPLFSPDGSRVSFSQAPVGAGGSARWNIYIVPATGGVSEMVCEECGRATGWSSDGKRIIGGTLEGQTWILDLASRRKRDLLATHHAATVGPFSPDNRWFTVGDDTSERGYIAPVMEAPVPESAWVHTIDDAPSTWSPDGNLLYVNSFRDGHTCIWAQRLDLTTKRPIGPPYPVFHSHDVRLSLGAPLAIGRDKMLFSMRERTGNIWMAEFKP
jgi:Tol biopolymer transport system component